MRKVLFAVAMLLLFSGVIIVSATANIRQEKIIETTKVARKVASVLDEAASSWSISGDFTKGRKLHVVIQPGRNWVGESAPGYSYIILNVSIRDPQGGETLVRVTFTADAMGTYSLQIDRVEVVSDGGGLTFEESDKFDTVNGTDYYDELWGIVNYSGSYNATVYRAAGVFSPPSILGLDSLLIEVEHPYLYVTVLGAGLIVISACLVIWGQKSSHAKRRIVKANQKS